MINYLQVENLTKSYGDLVLFDNISFTIGEGQRIALIGRNGSGKTTLLNILAGKDTADSGTITPRRDLRIAYLEQNPEYAAGSNRTGSLFPFRQSGLASHRRLRASRRRSVQNGLQEAMSPYGCPRLGLRTAGLNDFDFDKNRPASGGQLKRVAPAAVLSAKPTC